MSAITTSSCTFYQSEKLHLGRYHSNGYNSSVVRPGHPLILTLNHGFRFSAKPSLYYYNKLRGRSHLIKMNLIAINDINSGAPVPSGSPFPGWATWLLLTILPLALPFVKSKWGPLLEFKRKMDTVIDTVDVMSEIVEDIAVKVDKIADDITESLPDGSKLKKAIVMVDDVAEGVIKSADLVQELVDKVEEAEKNVETLMEKRTTEKEVEENEIRMNKQKIGQVEENVQILTEKRKVDQEVEKSIEILMEK